MSFNSEISVRHKADRGKNGIDENWLFYLWADVWMNKGKY